MIKNDVLRRKRLVCLYVSCFLNFIAIYFFLLTLTVWYVFLEIAFVGSLGTVSAVLWVCFHSRATECGLRPLTFFWPGFFPVIFTGSVVKNLAIFSSWAVPSNLHTIAFWGFSYHSLRHERSNRSIWRCFWQMGYQIQEWLDCWEDRIEGRYEC